MNPTMAPRSRPPEMPAAMGSSITMSALVPNKSRSASSVVCTVTSTKMTNAGRAYFTSTASSSASWSRFPQQHFQEGKPSEVGEGRHREHLGELSLRQIGLRHAPDRNPRWEGGAVFAAREDHLVARHADLRFDAGIDHERLAVALAVQQPGLARTGEAHAGHDVGVGEQLDHAAVGLDVDDAADQSGAGDDRHAHLDPLGRAPVDLQRVLEVGQRTGDDFAGHTGQLGELNDPLEGGELVQLLLGIDVLGGLALGALELGPQALVLLLQVAVVEQAVPGVADRGEDVAGTVPYRAEGARCGIADGVDGARSAEVEGEHRERGEDQQRKGEARPSGAARECQWAVLDG